MGEAGGRETELQRSIGRFDFCQQTLFNEKVGGPSGPSPSLSQYCDLPDLVPEGGGKGTYPRVHLSLHVHASMFPCKGFTLSFVRVRSCLTA